MAHKSRAADRRDADSISCLKNPEWKKEAYSQKLKSSM